MWEPQRLTTLWASTACYKYIFFCLNQLHLYNLLLSSMLIPHLCSAIYCIQIIAFTTASERVNSICLASFFPKHRGSLPFSNPFLGPHNFQLTPFVFTLSHSFHNVGMFHVAAHCQEISSPIRKQYLSLYTATCLVVLHIYSNHSSISVTYTMTMFVLTNSLNIFAQFIKLQIVYLPFKIFC
jgi:hypothetical protein